MTIIFLLLKNGSSFWVPPLEKIFTTSCISLSKHSVIHLLTTSLCFCCEQNNIVNLILQHYRCVGEGCKAKEIVLCSLCVATCIFECAAGNSPPGNKQRNQFKLKQNSTAFRKEQHTMQGTNAKKGRYKTWAGSTLSHIEKTISFIIRK